MRILGWVVCVAIALNFILFVLTFIPAFSGIGEQPGLADRLWGGYRSGGWRADVVWVFTSTIAIVIFGLAIPDSTSEKGTRQRKVIVTASAVWLCCFVVYVGYVLVHMMG